MSSSSPHHCLLNPVFIQRIHRFSTAEIPRTCELASVHSSWYETQTEHHGRYFCWKSNRQMNKYGFFEDALSLQELLCQYYTKSTRIADERDYYTPMYNNHRAGDADTDGHHDMFVEKERYPKFWNLKLVLGFACRNFPSCASALERAITAPIRDFDFGYDFRSFFPYGRTLFMQACKNDDVNSELISIYLDLFKILGTRKHHLLNVIDTLYSHNAVSLACCSTNFGHVLAVFRAIAEDDDASHSLFRQSMSNPKKPNEFMEANPFLEACERSTSETVNFLLDRIEELNDLDFLRKIIASARFWYGATSALQLLCRNGRIDQATMQRFCWCLVRCKEFVNEYDSFVWKSEVAKVTLTKFGIYYSRFAWVELVHSG